METDVPARSPLLSDPRLGSLCCCRTLNLGCPAPLQSSIEDHPLLNLNWGVFKEENSWRGPVGPPRGTLSASCLGLEEISAGPPPPAPTMTLQVFLQERLLSSDIF